MKLVTDVQQFLNIKSNKRDIQGERKMYVKWLMKTCFAAGVYYFFLLVEHET